MSQINPFRGLVSPSATPYRVQPKKDHDQDGRRQQHPHQQDEGQGERGPQDGEDGKPHVDLKA